MHTKDFSVIAICAGLHVPSAVRLTKKELKSMHIKENNEKKS